MPVASAIGVLLRFGADRYRRSPIYTGLDAVPAIAGPGEAEPVAAPKLPVSKALDRTPA